MKFDEGNIYKFMLVSISTFLIMAMAVNIFSPNNALADNMRGFKKSKRDFGTLVEKILNGKSDKYFGIKKPITASAPDSDVPYRTVEQTAGEQLLSADGLEVEYLTRTAGNKTDMSTFYPTENPSNLITCVEGGREVIGVNPDESDKYNPSVQRIDLATGDVETILRGMSRCDGIRTTPWGTILATEESDDGGAYEILDPLLTTEETVIDRSSGSVTNPDGIAKRTALQTMAWEGLTVLSTGVVIGGDELRPGGDTQDTDGGAIFKFVPEVLYSGGVVATLADSPLVSGNVYAMQISCKEYTSSSFPQYGQGCEIGQGTWVRVNASSARSDANANGATGYYRPEDLHMDAMYDDDANPNAVRFCWNNTGHEKSFDFAEVMCAIDVDPVNPASLVTANRFVEGDTDFNSFDNLAFQPVTGNLYVIEDHPNGDIFACLKDGEDRDIKSDGCVKVLSVMDSSAEPTGFIFSPDGKTAYVSIQHTDDRLMPLYDDYATDDLLKISGFKVAM